MADAFILGPSFCSHNGKSLFFNNVNGFGEWWIISTDGKKIWIVNVDGSDQRQIFPKR